MENSKSNQDRDSQDAEIYQNPDHDFGGQAKMYDASPEKNLTSYSFVRNSNSEDLTNGGHSPPGQITDAKVMMPPNFTKPMGHFQIFDEKYQQDPVQPSDLFSMQQYQLMMKGFASNSFDTGITTLSLYTFWLILQFKSFNRLAIPKPSNFPFSGCIL